MKLLKVRTGKQYLYLFLFYCQPFSIVYLNRGIPATMEQKRFAMNLSNFHYYHRTLGLANIQNVESFAEYETSMVERPICRLINKMAQ